MPYREDIYTLGACIRQRLREQPSGSPDIGGLLVVQSAVVANMTPWHNQMMTEQNVPYLLLGEMEGNVIRSLVEAPGKLDLTGHLGAQQARSVHDRRLAVR